MQLLQFREKTSGADAEGGGGRREQGSRKRLGVGAACRAHEGRQLPPSLQARSWGWSRAACMASPGSGRRTSTSCWQGILLEWTFLVGKNNIPSRTTK